MITKTELKKLYLKERKNTLEIGKIFGVSARVIRLRLKKYNIKFREWQPTKEKLEKMYNEKNMTQHEIALKLKCGVHVIERLMIKYNIPRRNSAKRNQSGKKNHMWKGGLKNTSGGYILVLNKNHPNADARGYVMKHHLVIEKHIGRYLKRYGLNCKNNEVVHHINGNKKDNRIKNLRLMKHGKHISMHRSKKNDM